MKTLGLLNLIAVLVTLYLVSAPSSCGAEDAQATSASPAAAKNEKPAQDDLGYYLYEGKSNKIARIAGADPLTVTLMFEGGGGCKVSRRDLPPQLKLKYPYDALKAAEFEKEQAGKAAKQAAQQAIQQENAAKNGIRTKEQSILAEIRAQEKRDVEIQKEVNILKGLPPGNGRRVKLAHLRTEQQGIRERIAKLNNDLERVRARKDSVP